MIRKRLIGVITVKGGWAVQSFGYARHLPLGRPEILAENLDRWGADEILVQCIDRGGLGPDLDLLDRISRRGLSTPLIYGGGIRSRGDAVATIQRGADRIAIDALLHDDPDEALALAEPLGAQAVIAALPLVRRTDGLLWRDPRSGHETPLPPWLRSALGRGALSEALIIDCQNEGQPGGFDEALLDGFPPTLPLIAFGGLSEPSLLRRVLSRPQVVAAGIGNVLSYREHAMQALKAQLGDLPLRPPHFEARP